MSSASGTSALPRHGPARQNPVASKTAPCAEQTSSVPKVFKNRSGNVSSGRPKCGQLFTNPRNSSSVCHMIRSSWLQLCVSEITKPRAFSGAMALARQITVPLGGSQKSGKMSGTQLSRRVAVRVESRHFAHALPLAKCYWLYREARIRDQRHI